MGVMAKMSSIQLFFLVIEDKGDKNEQELPEEPTSEEPPLEEPPPPQETDPQNLLPEQQCQPQEPELRKNDESKQQWPLQERKRDSEMYPPRKENPEPSSRRETTEIKHQEGESKSKLITIHSYFLVKFIVKVWVCLTCTRCFKVCFQSYITICCSTAIGGKMMLSNQLSLNQIILGVSDTGKMFIIFSR